MLMGLFLLGVPDMNMEGKFEAAVSIVPQKSQIFIIGCLILSGMSLFSTFAFLWAEKAGWIVPLAVSAVTGAVGFVCWLLSHRNSDLSGGKATELTADVEGVRFICDARNQPTKRMLAIFAAHAESMAFRERLPPSHGLLDESGNIIKDSEVAANLKIEQLNDFVVEQAQKLECLVGEIKTKGTIFQVDNVTAPVYTGGKPIEGVTVEG